MRAFSLLGLLLTLGIMLYLFVGGPGGGGQAAVELPLAFSAPSAGVSEMHVIVGVRQANPVRARDAQAAGEKVRSWTDWVRLHFALLGPDGNKVPLERRNNSRIIKALDVANMVGTEEFFLVARVRPGQTYTLQFVEHIPGGRPCAVQVTVPSQAQAVRRYLLQPVADSARG